MGRQKLYYCRHEKTERRRYETVDQQKKTISSQHLMQKLKFTATENSIHMRGKKKAPSPFHAARTRGNECAPADFTFVQTTTRHHGAVSGPTALFFGVLFAFFQKCF